MKGFILTDKVNNGTFYVENMFSSKAESFPRTAGSGLPAVNYGLHFTPRLSFLEVRISKESRSHLKIELRGKRTFRRKDSACFYGGFMIRGLIEHRLHEPLYSLLPIGHRVTHDRGAYQVSLQPCTTLRPHSPK